MSDSFFLRRRIRQVQNIPKFGTNFQGKLIRLTLDWQCLSDDGSDEEEQQRRNYDVPSAVWELQGFRTLKISNFLYSSLPVGIERFVSIRKLILDDCLQLVCLPDSIGFLQNLEILKIINCNNLKTFPPSVGELRKLKRLELIYCPEALVFPIMVGNFARSSLAELCVEGSSALEFPSGLGLLVDLQHLKVKNCRNLASLPPGISRGKLEKLTAVNCPKLRLLESLGESIKHPEGYYIFPNLKILSVDGCENIILSETLPIMTKLEGLKFKYLESFPSELFHYSLSSLRSLDLGIKLSSENDIDRDEDELREEEEVIEEEDNEEEDEDDDDDDNSIDDDNIDDDDDISNINSDNIDDDDIENHGRVWRDLDIPPDISRFRHLECLRIECDDIAELPPEICELGNLKELVLPTSSSLQALPSQIGNLTILRRLVLGECFNLRFIPNTIGNLQFLEELEISYTRSSTFFEGFPTEIKNLKALRHLDLSGGDPDVVLALFATGSWGNDCVLERIRLEGCQLTNIHLKQSNFLKELPRSLLQLDLSRNDFDDIDLFVSTIRLPTGIEALFLSEFDHPQIHQLVQKYPRLKKITMKPQYYIMIPPLAAYLLLWRATGERYDAPGQTPLPSSLWPAALARSIQMVSLHMGEYDFSLQASILFNMLRKSDVLAGWGDRASLAKWTRLSGRKRKAGDF